MGFVESAHALLNAIVEQDSWMMNEALNDPMAYAVVAVLMMPGIALILGVFKLIPWADENIEKYILVITYLTIGGVIFVEVIRRFAFSEQVPWSTTLPPYLFLVMTWVGCAYNVKRRSHLSFDEVRMALPAIGQLVCLFLDAALWLSFAWVVIVTTLRQTLNAAANFQILLGTDNVMQWWFYISVPVAWLVISARVFENLCEDVRDYRAGVNLMGRQKSMIQD